MSDTFDEIMNGYAKEFLSDELRISPKKMYINAKEKISFVRDKKFYNKMPEFKDLQPGDWLLCYAHYTGYEFNGKTWELEAIINPKTKADDIVIFSHIDGVPVTDINYCLLTPEIKTLNIPKSLNDIVCANNYGSTLNECLYVDDVSFNIIDKDICCNTAERKSDLFDFFGEENEEKCNNYMFTQNDSFGHDFFDE